MSYRDLAYQKRIVFSVDRQVVVHYPGFVVFVSNVDASGLHPEIVVHAIQFVPLKSSGEGIVVEHVV